MLISLNKSLNKKIKSLFFVSLTFIVIAVITIPKFVLSISFGAFPKADSMTISPGEYGDFEILFYSRSDETTQFYLSAKEYPNNFIITYPKSFSVDSSFLEDEYVVISGDYVKAKVVKTGVDVPESADIGEYRILLGMSSSVQDSEGTSLNVNAEKTFLFKVKVVEKAITEETGDIAVVGGLDIESEIVSENSRREDALARDTKENVEKKESESEVGNRSKYGITGLISYISENKILLTGILIGIVVVLIVTYKIYKNKKTSKYMKSYVERRLTWEELKDKWSG